MPRPEARCLTASLSVLYLPASSPSPDRQDTRRPRSRNPSTWSVEDVVWFVKDADPQALGPHVELFRKHVRAVAGLGAGRELRGCGGLCTVPAGTPQGRPHGTTGSSEWNNPLVLFVPSVPSLWPLSGVPVFLPIHPSVCASVCLCINKHL